MSKLKPCPFCGCEAKPTKYDQYDAVICSSCDASVYNECFTEEEVIAEWNNRSPVLKWRSADEKPENYSAIIFKSKAGIFSVGNYDSGTMRTQNGNKFSFDIYVTYWIPLSEVLAVIE